MNKINILNYLTKENIIFLNVFSKEEAMEKMTAALNLGEKEFDKKSFLTAVISRENIVSTGVGMGVAVPHAKVKTLDDFFIAVGVQKSEPLNWDSIDKSKVSLIFLIGGPEGKQIEYLNILSKLTLVIKNEGLKKKLLKAISQEEILNLFNSN